jgi:hypothetical protein
MTFHGKTLLALYLNIEGFTSVFSNKSVFVGNIFLVKIVFRASMLFKILFYALFLKKTVFANDWDLNLEQRSLPMDNKH